MHATHTTDAVPAAPIDLTDSVDCAQLRLHSAHVMLLESLECISDHALGRPEGEIEVIDEYGTWLYKLSEMLRAALSRSSFAYTCANGSLNAIRELALATEAAASASTASPTVTIASAIIAPPAHD